MTRGAARPDQPLLPLLWRARPIRFLLLLLVGWVLARSLFVAAEMRADGGDRVVPAAPPVPWSAAAPQRGGSRIAVATTGRPGETKRLDAADQWARAFGPAAQPDARPDSAQGGALPRAWIGGADDAGLGSNRHFLRLAQLGPMLPQAAVLRSGAAGPSPFTPRLAPWIDAPPAAHPLRRRGDTATSAIDRWSLAAWAFVRDGEASPGGAAGGGLTGAAPTLGGSQIGARLGYAIDPGARLTAFARLTVPPRLRAASDAAVGVSWRPFDRAPLVVSVEQRVALGGAARSAPAAYVAGGISDRALPHGFRIDAYGQAGVVGVKKPAAFVDGAIAAERPVMRFGDAQLSAGAVVAGAAQPGAARVDIGPRLSIRLPADAPQGRLSLDWRARVAGDARPGSGLALTLARDF
jgi:hypothetical protein